MIGEDFNYSTKDLVVLNYFFMKKGIKNAAEHVITLNIILLAYLHFSKVHPRLFSKYNGFMVKARKDISFSSGINPRKVTSIYGHLQEFGFIETSNKSFRKKYCVKVNFDFIRRVIDETKVIFDKDFEEYALLKENE